MLRVSRTLAERDEDFVVTDYDPRPPNGVGRSRFWRNVGGTYEDATAAVFEPDSIPDWGVENDNNKADFNGDGVLDLFRAHIGYDVIGVLTPGVRNTLLLSQPDGTLLDVSSTHLQPNEPDFTHGSSVADVDCDGDADLIVLNSLSKATLLYINDGTGGLIAENDRLAASGLSFPGSKAEFCDIDRDGDNDVVFGTTGLYDNRILVNDGFGRLRNAPASLPPDYFGVINNVAGTMACIDLNLDGWPDILLSPFPGDGALLLNAGGDAFVSQDFPWFGGSLVDANGDGKMDYLYPGHAPGVAPRLWYQR